MFRQTNEDYFSGGGAAISFALDMRVSSPPRRAAAAIPPLAFVPILNLGLTSNLT